MKKLIAFMALAAVMAVLTACGGGNAPTKDDAAQGGTDGRVYLPYG